MNDAPIVLVFHAVSLVLVLVPTDVPTVLPALGLWWNWGDPREGRIAEKICPSVLKSSSWCPNTVPLKTEAIK